MGDVDSPDVRLRQFRSPQESDEPIEFTGILHLGFPGLAFEVGI